MAQALDLIRLAIVDMNEDTVSTIPAVDMWTLVVKCQQNYSKKCASYRKTAGKGSRGESCPRS